MGIEILNVFFFFFKNFFCWQIFFVLFFFARMTERQQEMLKKLIDESLQTALGTFIPRLDALAARVGALEPPAGDVAAALGNAGDEACTSVRLIATNTTKTKISRNSYEFPPKYNSINSLSILVRGVAKSYSNSRQKKK